MKEGGFQRKSMTFCELTYFKHFEVFQKSCVRNHRKKGEIVFLSLA